MEKKKINETKLIVVIRIKGLVKVKSDITNTLDRLRLKRKYSCSLINGENKDSIGMLKKVKHYVAYGGISKEILIDLLKKRAKKIDQKEFKAEEVATHLIDGKTLKELGFKSFFRLHPPRKGIKSKLQYPKGVLGDNKEDINKLIERML
jgi:large subunit ribosomal protein L30